MLVGAVIGATVALVMMLVVYISNRGKTGSEYLQKMTRRVMHVSTPKSPDEVLAALAGGIPALKAAPSATDPNTKRVVLATPMSFATWGFWFPVHVSAQANGVTILDIGITSRGFQWGPLVTQAHRNFANAVAAQVGGTVSA